MTNNSTNRYRFVLHPRQLATLCIVSSLVLVIFGCLALLSNFLVLPIDLQGLIVPSYLVATIGLTVLLPVLLLQYSYAQSGVWIEHDKVGVRFAVVNEQELAWSEARIAVDE